MPHFRTLRDYQFENRQDDIRDADLYDVEGDKLGSIDDVIFDHGTGEIRYVVVDTGGLLSHDRFIVPADRIHTDDEHPNSFQIDLIKKHVERFPRYDERMVESEEQWRDYEKKYADAWTETGDVLHRKDSPNVITPPAAELGGGGAAPIERGSNVTPRRFATGQVAGPTSHPHVEESTPTSGAVLPRSREAARPIGKLPDQDPDRRIAGEGRWERFQENLRSRREDITRGCSVCERDRRAA